MLIDTHCHIHDPEYNFDPAETLSRAHKADVQKIIVIGTSEPDNLIAEAFANAHENVYYSYGYHPNEDYVSPRLSPASIGAKLQASVSQAVVEERPLASTSSHTAAPAPCKDRRALVRAPENRESEVLRGNTSNKLVAIGEIGLDYHYQPFDREQQIAHLEEYLELAKKLNLPLIFHVREAFSDFWPIIDNARIKNAVLHSFSDTQKNLDQAIKRNFFIGINGLATFANIPIPPLEKTLLETDAPYLTPKPFRGKINEPAYIPDIARWVAQYHGVTLEKVAEITTQNAERLFHI